MISFERQKGLNTEQLQTAMEWLGTNRRVVELYGGMVSNDSKGCPDLQFFKPMGVCDALIALDQENHDPIRLVINSPGGYLDSGLLVYDTIKSLQSPVWTICRGAMSAAVLPLVAGTPGRRYIYPHSRVLIHQPFVSYGETNATETKKLSRALNKNYMKIAELFKACGATKSIKRIMVDMKEEKWLDATEAIEYGLVDSLVNEETFGSE